MSTSSSSSTSSTPGTYIVATPEQITDKTNLDLEKKSSSSSSGKSPRGVSDQSETTIETAQKNVQETDKGRTNKGGFWSALCCCIRGSGEEREIEKSAVEPERTPVSDQIEEA